MAAVSTDKDTNVAKIEGDDLKIFMGLLADLFPGLWMPYSDTNVAKIEGDDLKIFMGLLADLFPGIDVPRARDYEMEEVLVDVMQADYGYTHDPDGYLLLKITQLIEKILKNAKTRRGEKTHGGEGDLDANWIESMNSVMDDNRLLTLPSNERIPLKVHMKMIFEIRDLNYATPATATRMDDTFGVQWRSYVKSWIKKQEHPDNVKEQLWTFFERCGSSTTLWMLKNTKYWFMFCFTSAVGLCLSEVDGIDYRKNFSNWWKGEMKNVKYPSKGGIFDYYVVKDAKFEEWSSAVEALEYSSDTPMGEVTVPTNETVAMTFLMRLMLVASRKECNARWFR
ncbi:Dynein alpha chain, flagellar outer arm [Symbiodinium microadriaticum]|uniref:Dynein alpha chain, flagellar outer arm n=1 Tax=Symbiodinium microadriaticum TaxID=2951 RepID=A0A1Q9EUM4_SYMMI|nr:Dynein alpha chain, flagellar outer arm [Symbiodinium microadriaticum]